jgi:hypothetical protein
MIIVNKLLIPWLRVFYEQLENIQLMKKFIGFCGTQNFITMFMKTVYKRLTWTV